MKGKTTVAIIIVILLIAIGTTFYFIMNFFENNPTQTKPLGYTTGIIIDTTDSSILVVDLSEEEARQITIEEAIENGENATWFRISMAQRNELGLYDRVKVGYESLEESYPASGEAKTIEKIEE